MKTKEELNALKEELVEIGKKLAELSDEELKEVTGGSYNLPGLADDEKYVLGRTPVKKDLYPNMVSGICGYNDNGSVTSEKPVLKGGKRQR